MVCFTQTKINMKNIGIALIYVAFFLSDRIFLMGDKKYMGIIGIDLYP